MSKSIVENPDLFSHAYGLALFALGVAALVLPRQSPYLPFAKHLGWLALFGILQGLLWAVEIMREAGAVLWLSWLCGVCFAVSFLALLEFARVVWNEVKTLPGLHALIVHGVAIAGIAGITMLAATPLGGLIVGSRYLAGAPAALLASIALLAISCVKLRGESTTQYTGGLRVCSLGLALFALLVLFVPGNDPGIPGWLPTESDFRVFTGFSVSSGRAFSALLISIGFIVLIRHAVHQTEDALSRIGDTINGFAYRDLPDGNSVFLTSGVENLTGYSAQEYLREGGIFYNDLIHPDDFDRVWEEAEKCLAADQEFGLSYRIIDRAGEVRWVYEHGRGAHDANGNLRYYDGHIVDDRLRKQAEQLMLEASELNDRIIKESPIGMSIYDSSGQCIVTNRAFAEMGGGTREGVLAQNYRNLESWEKGGLLEAANRSIELNRQERGQFELVTSFGKHAVYDAFFMPFESGGEPHLLLMIDDVTDRRKNEIELDRHRHHLEQLVAERTRELKQAQDEIMLVLGTLNGYVYRDIVTDVSKLGVESEIPVYITSGVEQLTGYSAEEFLGEQGRTFPDIIHPEDTDWVWAQVREDVAAQREFEVSYRIITRSGETRWVHERGHGVYAENGKAVYVEGYVLDDHERKTAETEIENQNAELERFAYSASHDLKTPLVTIKGFLGLLKQDIEKNDIERIQEDLAKIGNAADTMGVLLDDLLELSRAGHVMGVPVVCELSEVIRKAIELVETRIVQSGVEVTIDEMPRIVGDEKRLVEVYQNLIENGIKFMGDQVSPQIKIGARKKNGAVECYLQDNGIGIAAEYQHLVFELFERLNPEAEGTGVGLALVKRIIEMHGGQVSVKSEGEGCGTTFLFTLPAA